LKSSALGRICLGEVLGLMGDSADNVPGVPGIGPKTAAKLVQEFGTVDAGAGGSTRNEAVKDAGTILSRLPNRRGSRACW
jgi:DNA polymerase-1